MQYFSQSFAIKVKARAHWAFVSTFLLAVAFTKVEKVEIENWFSKTKARSRGKRLALRNHTNNNFFSFWHLFWQENKKTFEEFCPLSLFQFSVFFSSNQSCCPHRCICLRYLFSCRWYFSASTVSPLYQYHLPLSTTWLTYFKVLHWIPPYCTHWWNTFHFLILVVYCVSYS